MQEQPWPIHGLFYSAHNRHPYSASARSRLEEDAARLRGVAFCFLGAAPTLQRLKSRSRLLLGRWHRQSSSGTRNEVGFPPRGFGA